MNTRCISTPRRPAPNPTSTTTSSNIFIFCFRLVLINIYSAAFTRILWISLKLAFYMLYFIFYTYFLFLIIIDLIWTFCAYILIPYSVIHWWSWLQPWPSRVVRKWCLCLPASINFPRWPPSRRIWRKKSFNIFI